MRENLGKSQEVVSEMGRGLRLGVRRVKRGLGLRSSRSPLRRLGILRC